MADQLPTKSIEESVPQELVLLCGHIVALPALWRDRIEPLLERLCQFTRLQERYIRSARHSVDQLQLELKCLAFDLEVTQRERDSLRRQLERFEDLT